MQRSSGVPELEEVKVGFIPLTDCAPIAVAAELGFDQKYGIKIIPSRQASWAAIRDRTLSGELHAAQLLYGMVYGVQLGIGGLQHDMAILMTLSSNGQGITLGHHMHDAGVDDGVTLKKLVDRHARDYVFAQTFPTGTHAMWLYYWLAAHGIHPLQDVRAIVVPPPQMVANLLRGNMDGFCAGEPWNARAVRDGVGFTVATSQAIWADHPEKVLGTTAEFVARYPNTARALVMAILEACRHLDVMAYRPAVARMIAGESYVDASESMIEGRFMGRYDNGLGRQWQDAHPMRFFDEGRVNFPYLSDGMWFMTQHRRWGLLQDDPDYLEVARQVNQIDLYSEAASALGVALPGDVLRSSTLMDGVVWDGKNPQAYAAQFRIKAD